MQGYTMRAAVYQGRGWRNYILVPMVRTSNTSDLKGTEQPRQGWDTDRLEGPWLASHGAFVS